MTSSAAPKFPAFARRRTQPLTVPSSPVTQQLKALKVQDIPSSAFGWDISTGVVTEVEAISKKFGQQHFFIFNPRKTNINYFDYDYHDACITPDAKWAPESSYILTDNTKPQIINVVILGSHKNSSEEQTINTEELSKQIGSITLSAFKVSFVIPNKSKSRDELDVELEGTKSRGLEEIRRQASVARRDPDYQEKLNPDKTLLQLIDELSLTGDHKFNSVLPEDGEIPIKLFQELSLDPNPEKDTRPPTTSQNKITLQDKAAFQEKLAIQRRIASENRNTRRRPTNMETQDDFIPLTSSPRRNERSRYTPPRVDRYRTSERHRRRSRSMTRSDERHYRPRRDYRERSRSPGRRRHSRDRGRDRSRDRIRDRHTRPGPRDEGGLPMRDSKEHRSRPIDKDPKADKVHNEDDPVHERSSSEASSIVIEGTDDNMGKRKQSRTHSPRSKKRARGETAVKPPKDHDQEKHTVFVQQLSVHVTEEELKTFFSDRAGPVKAASIVQDRVSKRSKGVGYVEFNDEVSAERACDLTGQQIKKIPIIVSNTEASKNKKTQTGESKANAPFHRLYVGNIHFEIGEEELKTLFGTVGTVKFCQLQREETGKSKGYAFVEYENPTDARNALDSLNNVNVAGRQLRVGLGNDKVTGEPTQDLSAENGSSFSGRGGRGQAGSSGPFDRAGGRDDFKGIGQASALDDTDIAGVNYRNVSRHDLMTKLARSGEKNQPEPVKPLAKSKPPMQTFNPTRTIVIRNVFVYEEESKNGPNWVNDLEEEMKVECEEKYGKVVHLHVDQSSESGEVHVKFADKEGGDKALKGLNGRIFDGRYLNALPVEQKIYDTLYPKTVKL